MSEIEYFDYIFKIDGLSPNTISMLRLSEYLHAVAELLGEKDRVHFSAVRQGSLCLAFKVESQANNKVRERIELKGFSCGQHQEDKDIARINKLLIEDNAKGQLLEISGGTEVIPFPGRDKYKVERPYRVQSEGTLDGVITKIGGINDRVRVHLHDGDTNNICETTKTIAKELGYYLFDTYIRLTGQGRWLREVDGKWRLESFEIKSFEKLRSNSFMDIVSSLRNPDNWSSDIDYPDFEDIDNENE